MLQDQDLKYQDQDRRISIWSGLETKTAVSRIQDRHPIHWNAFTYLIIRARRQVRARNKSNNPGAEHGRERRAGPPSLSIG